MKSAFGKVFRIIPALAILTLAWSSSRPGLLAADEGKPVAFIVNIANPMDSLTSAELRRLYTSERTNWPDGRRVTLVMVDEGRKERATILRSLFGMSESGYRKFILQSTSTGNSRSDPKVVADGTVAVKFVSLVPDAIGYASVDQVDSSVKVLKVDGLSPSATGYRFRIQ